MNDRLPLMLITDDCILALHLDFKRGKEHMLIGDRTQVQQYLWGNKEAVIFEEAKRDIGTFIMECMLPVAGISADTTNDPVYGPDNLNLFCGISQEQLEDMAQSDNLCHRFLAFRLWREIENAKPIADKVIKSTEDVAYMNKVSQSVGDLILPFCTSIDQDIMTQQREHQKSPLRYVDDAFYHYPCGLLWAGNQKNDEYGFASVSLLPLIVYELKRFYENHLYLKRCKLCGELFLGPLANIATYCGEDCKREGIRQNKQRFDEKAKLLDYERQNKSNYMYWYNKVKKLQKESPGSEKLIKVQQAFDLFKAGNAKRKTAVKTGEMPEKEYIDWLYLQQTVIDGLMLE